MGVANAYFATQRQLPTQSLDLAVEHTRLVSMAFSRPPVAKRDSLALYGLITGIDNSTINTYQLPNGVVSTRCTMTTLN
ncbi:hypothetical protein AAHC03_05689 [Spirometra sp. Aus1]